jgi:hypothetical protein
MWTEIKVINDDHIKKNMDFNKMQGQAGMYANYMGFFIIQ